MKVATVSLAGLVLFAWPFLLPLSAGGAAADAPAAALAAAAVLGLLLLELGTRSLDSRRLALLAALAAIDAALRAAVVVGIGGWSPIYFLVLAAGWVFGAGYGFLVGAFSLLVSAIVTGGLGPWVPYEMFGLGWVGLVAGIAGRWRSPRGGVRDLVVLAAVGALSGWAYGALMDIQVWVAGYRGPGPLGWLPGMPATVALRHFAGFYVFTSLAFDSFRAAGNAAAILFLGAPVVAALERLRARLTFVVVPVDAVAPRLDSPA